MSKLRELVGKGVRLIVADSEESGPAGAPPRAREIPAEDLVLPEEPVVQRSEVPADVADFGAVYQEAGIELPLHGYSVDKVAEMLENKRLANLSREVKATAVLTALEAADVPIRDVIQDAVRRDKALDDFEAAKERELQELKTKGDAKVKSIQGEIERFLKEKNAEIESLKKAVEAATQAFSQLQLRKRREEERLHQIVSHFVETTDNPVTTGEASPPPPPRKPDTV